MCYWCGRVQRYEKSAVRDRDEDICDVRVVNVRVECRFGIIESRVMSGWRMLVIEEGRDSQRHNGSGWCCCCWSRRVS